MLRSVLNQGQAPSFADRRHRQSDAVSIGSGSSSGDEADTDPRHTSGDRTLTTDDRGRSPEEDASDLPPATPATPATPAAAAARPTALPPAPPPRCPTPEVVVAAGPATPSRNAAAAAAPEPDRAAMPLTRHALAVADRLNAAPVSRPQPMNPRRVLFIGSPGTGKSSLINAIRQATSPSVRWERAPTGIIGRSSTTCTGAYFNTLNDERAPATWMYMDTPGRNYEGINSPGHDDERLVSMLIHGLPFGVPLAGRDAMTVAEVEAVEHTAPFNAAEHVVIVAKATDLVVQRGAWFGLRTVLEDSPACSGTLHYLADMLEALRYVMHGRAAHVVFTHLDLYGDPVAAEEAIRKRMVCCPQTNQHYIGMPVSTATRDVVARRKAAATLQPTQQRAASARQPQPPGALVAARERGGASDVSPARRQSFRAPDCVPGGLALSAHSHEQLVGLADALGIEIAAFRARLQSAAKVGLLTSG